MPHDRTPARKPAGPGRPSRRPRGGAPRAGAPDGTPTTRTPPAPIAQVVDAVRARPKRGRPFGLTGRAFVLFAVLALLGLSYVQSLRVYLVQQGDLATAQRQIAERSARVAQLEDELQRWRDPAFLKAQARTRLGWVMPGEVGYRVIGLDGKVLSGDTEIEGIGSHTPSDFDPRWWDRLVGSVRAADDPAPVEP